MPPSSMTKLMTMYIVYDRLKQGRLKLDDELPVTEKAWRTQGSKMFVQVGILGEGGGPDPRRHRAIRQRRRHRAGGGDRRVGGAVRRTDEQDRRAARPDPFELQELHRLARPRPAHERARHRHAGRADHPRLPGILSLRRGEIVPLQRHRPGQPQPDGAEGHGGRAEDRPHRSRRLRACRQFQAQRPPRDRGAQRHDLDARTRRGVGAA